MCCFGIARKSPKVYQSDRTGSKSAKKLSADYALSAQHSHAEHGRCRSGALLVHSWRTSCAELCFFAEPNDIPYPTNASQRPPQQHKYKQEGQHARALSSPQGLSRRGPPSRCSLASRPTIRLPPRYREISRSGSMPPLTSGEHERSF